MENQNNKQGREYSAVESGELRGWELFKEFNRLITNDEDEKRFIPQVVNQAGKLSPSETHIGLTRESAVDISLATSLPFIGSKTVFGVEVLKQDQLAFSIRFVDGTMYMYVCMYVSSFLAKHGMSKRIHLQKE